MFKKKWFFAIAIVILLSAAFAFAATYTGTNIKDLDATTPTEGASPPSEINDSIREIKTVYLNQNGIAHKTGAYTLSATDAVITCNGTFTVTLPTVSSVSSSTRIKEYVVINVGTGTITVDGNGAETIDGAAAKTIEIQYSAMRLYGNGTAWYTSNLNSDTLDGKNPGSANGIATLDASSKVEQEPATKGQANGIATLDASTLVPLAQIPTTLTGKDADTVDGKHASNMWLKADLTPWHLIYETDITTATQSVTVSGLNGNVDKEYKVIARFINDGTGNALIYLRPNNDSGSNYGFQAIQGVSSTAGAARSTTETGLWLSQNSVSTMSFTEGLLYAKSGYARMMLTNTMDAVGGTTIGRALFIPSVWNNTSSNITSLVFYANQANGIGVGSHIEIWTRR